MDSKNIFTNRDDDPPDRSQILKNETLEEPLKSFGSFFVGSNENELEIVSDIEQCRSLWREFCSQKTLFDTWEFRSAFYSAYRFKPCFVLIKNNEKRLALLPLEYNEDEKQYVWFGSSWQEENKFFAKDPALIPALLSLAPKPLYLNAIDFNSADLVKNYVNFQMDDSKYVLDLSDIKNSDEFLMHLNKNNRRNLRKDKYRIARQNPEIVINDFNDFDKLVQLSRDRLKQLGDAADWEDPRRVEAFRQVIKSNDKSYKLRMISVKINGKTAGVDLIAILDDCYYAVKCGYDVKNFSGIGNYINLLEIDDAIALGKKKIDFLQNNYEWKSKFFKAVPLFKYSQS